MPPRPRMISLAPMALGIVCVTAACGLISCAQMPKLSALLTPENSKEKAQERWNRVRSRLKYQLATDGFATGKLDRAQEHLDEAIALDPASADNYVLKAKLLLERGEIASAAAALETARNNGANDAVVDYLGGVIAERYGHFSEALYQYQQASTRDPSSAHYVAAVAETLVALDRPTEALALVRDKWTDFEQNATLRAIAGGIYMMLGQYEQAADAYRDAGRIATDDVLLQFQLGEALTRAGQYDEARIVLVLARARSETTPPYALLALGRCHLALNQNEEAHEAFQQATQAAADDPRGWSGLAQAALACNDLIGARRAAARTAELDPSDAESQMLLGYVCWRQQDLPAAAAALDRSLQKSPGDPLARYLRDRVASAKGTAIR